MAGEDGELLLEEGGVIGGDVDADGRLLQPLVAAPIICSEAKSSQQTRLASLDVFRGLSIGVYMCSSIRDSRLWLYGKIKKSMALCDRSNV
jgi:hypothetical protein